jgi:hypothetical protein
MNLVAGFDRQEILFRLSGLREIETHAKNRSNEATPHKMTD